MASTGKPPSKSRWGFTQVLSSKRKKQASAQSPPPAEAGSPAIPRPVTPEPLSIEADYGRGSPQGPAGRAATSDGSPSSSAPPSPPTPEQVHPRPRLDLQPAAEASPMLASDALAAGPDPARAGGERQASAAPQRSPLHGLLRGNPGERPGTPRPGEEKAERVGSFQQMGLGAAGRTPAVTAGARPGTPQPGMARGIGGQERSGVAEAPTGEGQAAVDATAAASVDIPPWTPVGLPHEGQQHGEHPGHAHVITPGGIEKWVQRGVAYGEQMVGPTWDQMPAPNALDPVRGVREMRVVSLVPAATEVLCALGLESALVARSHDCAVPEALAHVPCVSAPLGNVEDTQAGPFPGSKARVAAEAILQLQPTVIIAQDGCDMCDVTTRDLQTSMREAMASPSSMCPLDADGKPLLYGGARLVTIRPFMLSDVWDGIRAVADAMGMPERGQQHVEELKQRWASVRQAVPRRRRAHRVRVACLGQLSPLRGSGWWIPEIIACAGGIHVAGKAGERTEALSLELLTQRDPDVIVIACQGMSLAQALRTLLALPDLDAWDALSAVKLGRVYAIDGTRFLNSPGPRVVESVEVMADLLQRDFLDFTMPNTAEPSLAQTLSHPKTLGEGAFGPSFPRSASLDGEGEAGQGGKTGSNWLRSSAMKSSRGSRVWPMESGAKSEAGAAGLGAPDGAASAVEQLLQAISSGAPFVRLPGTSVAEWRQEIGRALQDAAPEVVSGSPSADLSMTSSLPLMMQLPKTIQLRQLVFQTMSECLPADCLLLSGGVASSVLAFCASALYDSGSGASQAQALGLPPPIGSAITVVAALKGSDRQGAARVAAKYSLPHVVVGGTEPFRAESLLSSELRFVVRTLKTFDPPEVRAGIAVAAALREAKRRGCMTVLTGDGADELFSAFDFLLNMDEEKALRCRRHIQETMRFPVTDLARAMGLQVVQPFLHPAVKEFALSLAKGDLQCEGHDIFAPWASQFADSKLLLRLAFPEVEASQRKSDAIEVGAGTSVLTKRLLKKFGKDDLNKHTQQILHEDGVAIRDAEHLHYYLAFREEFEGLQVPGVQRWGLNACLSCGFPPHFEGQLACTTCGEYPARRLTKHAIEGWEGGATEEKLPAVLQTRLNQAGHRMPPGLPKGPLRPSWRRKGRYGVGPASAGGSPPAELAADSAIQGEEEGAMDMVRDHKALDEARRDGTKTGASKDMNFDELFALHEVFVVFGGLDGDDESMPAMLGHIEDGLTLWRSTWGEALAY